MKAGVLNTRPRIVVVLFSVVLICLGRSDAQAQSRVFTYQGSLNDGSTPATGNYELQFTLFDSADAGNAVGGGPIASTSRIQVHHEHDGSFLRLSRGSGFQEFLDVVWTTTDEMGTAFPLYTSLWNGHGYFGVRSLVRGRNGKLGTSMSLSVTHTMDSGYPRLRSQSTPQGGPLRLPAAEKYPTWVEVHPIYWTTERR